MIIYKSINLQRVVNQQKGKTKYIINGNEYFAEEAAIKYYESLGYNAQWTENAYWWMLMSLLFWDIIFAKIQGVVTVRMRGVQTELSPDDPRFEQLYILAVQMNGMPSDFFSQEFYIRRKSLINNKIEELRHSNIEEKLVESYQKNYKKPCRPIENWDKYKIDELLISIRRAEKEKFLKILERLISNFKDNRAGLPDLIVYNDNSFFFSEVKSEKDKISDIQKDWHDFLSQTLGFNVEICLINQSEDQINQIETEYVPSVKEVVLFFGYSSSEKREEAIRFMKEQDTYFTRGDGKEQVYGAKFKMQNIENLYKIYDLTNRWKTLKIEIDGENVDPSILKGVLWCFNEKIKLKASLDYCHLEQYSNLRNKFGCRLFHFTEMQYDEWINFGYIDTNTSDWVFDKEKIKKEIEERIGILKYCPIFNSKHIYKILKNLPDKINPKIDNNWAYISNEHVYWFYHDDKWLNYLGETNLPGINLMVGIYRITTKEKNDAILYAKNKEKLDISYKYTPEIQTKKQGCFIATAVYGNSNTYQVRILRNFRDTRLETNFSGKLFVNIYYKISPFIAKHLNRLHFLSAITRKILDLCINAINKYD